MNIPHAALPLALLAVLSLSACDQKAQQTTDLINIPATASGEAVEGPEIMWLDSLRDFGTVREGESVSYAFKFKNIGGGPLLITKVVPSCGCTVPEFSQDPIGPGKEGSIKLVFNSKGKPGKNNKTVQVLANTVPNSHKIAFTANVIPAQ